MITEIERAIVFLEEARTKLEYVAEYMDPKDLDRHNMVDVVNDLSTALYTLKSLGNARYLEEKK